MATKALGYQQLTVLSAAQQPTIPPGTSMILIVAEGQAIRWRDDGVSPTAAVGMPLAAGTIFMYDAAQMPRLKFIEQAAGAKVNLSFYA